MRRFRLCLLASIVIASSTAQADGLNLSLNPDFADSNVAVGSYKYAADPIKVPGWKFEGLAGIASSSSAWGGEAATGTVAFLQKYGTTPAEDASMTQTFTSTAMSFTITLEAAQRGSYGIGSFAVYLNNRIVYEGTPADADFESVEIEVDSVSGTFHTLTLRATDNPNAGTDASVYINDVEVVEGITP